MSAKDQRLRILAYLYDNRNQRFISWPEIQGELRSAIMGDLDYLRDEEMVEYHDDPDLDPSVKGFLFDVRITSKGVDYVESSRATAASAEHRSKQLEVKSLTMTEDQERKALAILFDSLRIHEAIRGASARLFVDGHYAQSILEAYKALIHHVKTKSGKKDLEGRSLMSTVFSADNPILALNALRSPSDRDEQEGFMLLYMGAVIGVRNPKAHDLIRQQDPHRALEYIVLASLLAKRADESRKLKPKESRRSKQTVPKAPAPKTSESTSLDRDSKALALERKASQERELAERVYTPLRIEVASWASPEEVFNGSSSKTWTDLKQNAPYLVLRAPRDLVDMLNSAESLLKRTEFLAIQVRAMIEEETKRLGIELCAKAGVISRGSPLIRVLCKSMLIKNVDLGIVWSTRMSLREWVEKYVKDNYPVEDWHVEVINGYDSLGDLSEAEEIAGRVFAFLKDQPFAPGLQQKIYEVKELAQKAMLRIDEELSKAVVPLE